ncbi:MULTISPECIES: hypothetical protein [unclassified Streptomyces]|uniref:Uncharacterized protein n=1 Tax=Streptomyces johnsoniae TaxID=3075532 RepID=A0ABU2S0Y0_9ACTN|nr:MULTISPECIES: hypothetical protein [unclassified Streptomyces]MDT0442600.1 hypothetical protein [Streptomyces sp. DSM 41886]ONK15927.1 hypothetical protein STBA_67700 [Streptomyces sp. MP131-18]
MLAQKTTPFIANPTEEAAVHALMVEQEAPLSDAPLYSPEAVGVLLLLLLLSPKTPSEPGDK